MRKLAVVAVLVALAVAPSRAGESSTRFQSRGDGNIVVPVKLDGRGPFRFLLDTGSSRSVISTEAARTLGLAPVLQSLMVTPTGRALRPLVPLKGVAVDSTRSFDVMALLVDRRNLGSGGDLDGLIGQDLLSQLIYTIDYARRVVTWNTGWSSTRGTRLHLEPSEGRLLVSLPQPWLTGTSLWLIPDSAADCIVLFVRPGRKLPAFVPMDTAGLRTMVGQRIVRRVLLDRLDIGSAQLRDQQAVVVDRDELDAPLGDGLLPLHLFERVTFDVSARSLIVEPR